MDLTTIGKKALLTAAIVGVSAYTAGVGAVGLRALINGTKKGVSAASDEIAENRKLTKQESKEPQSKEKDAGGQVDTIG